MYLCNQWRDYEVLDTGDGEKLERWGEIVLRRPDPQVIWPKADPSLWAQAQAVYERSDVGGGHWTFAQKLPERWVITLGDLRFYVKPTGFKHTGLFPEQAVNWDLVRGMIEGADRPVKVLNLFAYTGGATVACLKSGAQVVHVDASKGMVQWAKENAAASGVADGAVRWIVDDCIKFVQREIRRGNRYDIVILDPPSYGRGPKGEIWHLEDNLYDFVTLVQQVLSDDALAVVLNSYTTGLSASVMQYILEDVLVRQMGGSVSADEIGLPVTETGGVLPCGATAVWKGKDGNS